MSDTRDDRENWEREATQIEQVVAALLSSALIGNGQLLLLPTLLLLLLLLLLNGIYKAPSPKGNKSTQVQNKNIHAAAVVVFIASPTVVFVVAAVVLSWLKRHNLSTVCLHRV